MAAFENFIGGSYQGRSQQQDAERSANQYVEPAGAAGANAKGAAVLLSKPGLATFATFAAGAVVSECALNGRGFAVVQLGASNYFYEVLASGLSINYGTLPGDRRSQMCASQNQIVILSGGLGFCFTLATNTLALITSGAFPIGAVKVGNLDGYFVVLEPNSQVFAISSLNDGTTWNALDYGDAEGEPGNITTFIVDHRQIWFFGNNHAEIYYDSGAANFPLARLEGAFMEQGAGVCIDGLFQCDNTIFWLGGNRDGQGIFWRANGYQPTRISTPAIEYLVEQWPTLADVSGYCYQESGHTFARWDAPSANGGLGASLLFDVLSGFWHERFFWNASLGLELADLARSHMFVFGKHLVGDWRSGTIYEQSMQYNSDAGAQIRRIRAAPDLSNGGKYVKYAEFRLLCDVGVGRAVGS